MKTKILTCILSMTLVVIVYSQKVAAQNNSKKETFSLDSLIDPVINIYYDGEILTKENLLKATIQDEAIIPILYLIMNPEPKKYKIKADSVHIVFAVRDTIPRRLTRILSDDAFFMLHWPPNTSMIEATRLVFVFYYSYYTPKGDIWLANRRTSRQIRF